MQLHQDACNSKFFNYQYRLSLHLFQRHLCLHIRVIKTYFACLQLANQLPLPFHYEPSFVVFFRLLSL